MGLKNIKITPVVWWIIGILCVTILMYNSTSTYRESPEHYVEKLEVVKIKGSGTFNF